MNHKEGSLQNTNYIIQTVRKGGFSIFWRHAGRSLVLGEFHHISHSYMMIRWPIQNRIQIGTTNPPLIFSPPCFRRVFLATLSKQSRYNEKGETLQLHTQIESRICYAPREIHHRYIDQRWNLGATKATTLDCSGLRWGWRRGWRRPRRRWGLLRRPWLREYGTRPCDGPRNGRW